MSLFARSLTLSGLLLVLILLHTSAFAQTDTAAVSTGDGYLRADRLGITFISSVDTPNNDARYQRALSLGAGWNRWPLYWSRVEGEEGRFQWDAYDALIESDLEHGLNTNVILLGMPDFHRDEQTIAGLYEPIFADGSDTPREGKAINPENPWARFVHEAARRYRPGGILGWANGWEPEQGVRVWEIWNEPDFANFWQGGVRDYTRMLKTAYLVIHQLDPQATVMVGGLLYPTQNNWLAQVLGLIINDPFHEQFNWYLDAVAVHSYGNSWRSGWLTLYVRQTLIAFEIDRPIWLNESGVATWDDYPGPTWLADRPGERATRATATQQAAFFIQSTAYAWAEGARVVFYHQLYDDCGDQAPGTNFAPDNGEQFGDAFGLFRNTASSVCYSQHPEPDSARPVAQAFQLLADVFGGQPFSRRGVIEENGNTVAITFSRPASNERVVVLWNNTTQPLAYELPALGERAQVYTIGRGSSLVARNEAYTLTLPAAQMPSQRSTAPGGAIDIGGMPLILVESVPAEAARRLFAETLENVPTPEPDATPAPAVYLSDEDIDALMAASPTGVAFTSLNISRLRSAPNTETSRVITTMPVGNSASVVGRTADSGWLLIDYEGQQLWLAAFLGDVHGDLDDVPVIQVAQPAPPASDATAEGTS